MLIDSKSLTFNFLNALLKNNNNMSSTFGHFKPNQIIKLFHLLCLSTSFQFYPWLRLVQRCRIPESRCGPSPRPPTSTPARPPKDSPGRTSYKCPERNTFLLKSYKATNVMQLHRIGMLAIGVISRLPNVKTFPSSFWLFRSVTNSKFYLCDKKIL